MGKSKCWLLYRIDIPQLFSEKTVTGNYVGDPYECAKFGANPSTGEGFWTNGELNAHVFLFIYIFLHDIDATEKVVISDFGSETEILPFLRIRNKNISDLGTQVWHTGILCQRPVSLEHFT